MQLCDGQFLGGFVRFHDAEIGDNGDRAFAGKAKALPRFAAVEVADGSDEVEFFHESAGRLFQYEHDFVRATGDFGGARGTGKASGRFPVVGDDGGVDVGEAIDVRRPEEADIDATSLQPVAKNLRSGDNSVGRFGEVAIANGKRKDGRLCADGAGLVNKDDIGRVGEAREICSR